MDLEFSVTDDRDEETRGPLSPRNRYVLCLALRNITADLDCGAADWDDWGSLVRRDMPRIVHDQPKEWWRKLCDSAERLYEAARTGTIDELVPRTPGEEALIYLATTTDYVDWAKDWLTDEPNLWAVFDALPEEPGEDGDYQEILGHLTGDTDVAFLWMSELDGIEDPNDDANLSAGIGDYRPHVWHEYFDSRRPAE